MYGYSCLPSPLFLFPWLWKSLGYMLRNADAPLATWQFDCFFGREKENFHFVIKPVSADTPTLLMAGRLCQRPRWGNAALSVRVASDRRLRSQCLGIRSSPRIKPR
ncbi:hypothetical protein LX36DRAFT_28813 [Colletotrichum falcatum]|nr:hypothetical protein LX36DRAFT_28813 [Colletotrichum falcatum]